MLKLCAYYLGDVDEADRARFDAHVENTHLPLVARYPGLKSLEYHKSTPWNDKAPEYYLAFELGFADQAAFDLAMGSDIRRIARDDLGNFLPMFKGTVHHVLHEVNEIPLP
ncbi:MAG: EthD family reductase [Rhodobacteraceae bacterium]|nr:EthD family reductase [Paracoccaceae bacterium]